MRSLILVSLLTPTVSYAVDTYYILPDKFEIQTIAGNPMFSVTAAIPVDQTVNAFNPINLLIF